MKNSVYITAITLSLVVSVCIANTAKSCCPPVGINTKTIENVNPHKPLTEYTLEDILKRLRYNNSRLESYKCKVRYLVIQDPELMDSRTLRKGILYYKKDDSGSRIRVNFDTVKQDDETEQKQNEQFIFDGVWLTKIDYSMKKVDHYQQSQLTKPLDVFEFVSHNFPIVGFSKIENLHKQFEIKIVEKPAKSGKPIRLHLKVKKDSVYKDDYTEIDFWIDSKTFLPARVVSHSTEDDIYDIQLINAEINKNLKNTVFKVENPKDFSENRHPLKKDSKGE